LNPYLLYIYAVCGEGIAADTLENAIYDEIDKIKTQGITDEELLKVKNTKLMDFYRAMETINGKADNIGQYEIFMGDYKKLFSAPGEYQKVTVDDIKRTAATYLVKSNRTVGILKKIEEE
jgi:zinc protease